MDLKRLIFYSTMSCFAAIPFVISVETIVIPADELCLKCICEMATGCNLTYGCDNQGLCGPFRMTKPYWIDGGKPVLNLDDPERPGAFARCANDPVCASAAVRGYTDRYGGDCNNDERIDCLDYARIHQYGYGNEYCKRELLLAQSRKFKKCLSGKI